MYYELGNICLILAVIARGGVGAFQSFYRTLYTPPPKKFSIKL